jgi:ABC-type phosphate transport system ATPase subunit
VVSGAALVSGAAVVAGAAVVVVVSSSLPQAARTSNETAVMAAQARERDMGTPDSG